jgi:hypothetical protein
MRIRACRAAAGLPGVATNARILWPNNYPTTILAATSLHESHGNISEAPC